MKDFEFYCRERSIDPDDPEAFYHYKHGTEPSETKYCHQCGRLLHLSYCYYCDRGTRPVKTEAERERGEARALALWNEAVPIAGTLVEHYLRHHRKIAQLPPSIGDALRFHPQCPFGREWKGATMVALLRDVSTDHRPCGIIRTPIHRDQGKLAKPRAFGTFYRTAVKLWPGPLNGKLTIGEGIETVLAAMELMPNLPPAWAVCTAGNVGVFPVIDAVSELHILADNDPQEKGSVGQAKAEQCAGRYSVAAKKVKIHTPRKHKDFNDILRELRHAGC